MTRSELEKARVDLTVELERTEQQLERMVRAILEKGPVEWDVRSWEALSGITAEARQIAAERGWRG